MKARHKRLALVAGGVAVLGVGAWLIMSAFQQNLTYFYTPTEVLAGKAPSHHTIRIGGMVEAGTLKRQADGLTWGFVVTDMAQRVPVTYHGILPDLFKEGKGVVAEGTFDSGSFNAEQVLAKHDENYMPPDAAYAMKKGQEAKDAAAKLGSTVVADQAKGSK